MVLYTPENHEPLTDSAWAEEVAHRRIREIVAVTDAAFDEVDLWPADPQDLGGATPPLESLYAGASGLVWALDRLRPHAATRLELADVAWRTLEAWRDRPDYPERLDEPPQRSHASLFFGESGPLYVAWSLTGDGTLADDLYRRVRDNAHAQANELMWSSVGTMHVAWRMLDRTGEPRWADAWRESAGVLLGRRDQEGLWATMPFGRGLGAAHGASTTAHLLLQGRDLLRPETRDEPALATSSAIARYAVVEDGLANWPMVTGDELVGFDGQIRTQWCHGAAGVVASAADYLDTELLLAGAELCWRAGPASLEKGPGLCHGTAGTGYAFLRVFGRTGDELWLERARCFALHAFEQVERLGPPRHSLFTGGLGAALLAADCLDVRTEFPIVDVL
jgi:lanthionine synthetase-like protein